MRHATQHLCTQNFDKPQSESAERAFHHSAENQWRMVDAIHGDDDAVKTRKFWHGSADLPQRWLRQCLHINLAGEQAGEEQVAGAAEIIDLKVQVFNQAVQWAHMLREGMYYAIGWACKAIAEYAFPGKSKHGCPYRKPLGKPTKSICQHQVIDKR